MGTDSWVYPDVPTTNKVVRMIAECFNIEDEEIFDTLLNRSDKLSHFVELYQLKLAS
ncbi:hypothetical protein SAMN04487902_1125 [Prevotella sp. ne3005]|nr:hypothetical protein SAMN04487902_1125 [Prevotella sp. ne3005]